MSSIAGGRRLAALVGLTALLRAPSFFRPFMDVDEGSYAAIACRMLQGGLPYRDGVENKFPAIYYVYYGLFAVFGRFNMVAVHVAVAVTALLTALTCGAAARRLAGEQAGWMAALFYTLFSTFYYPKILAGNTEMFLVLPSALAVYAYICAAQQRWLYVAAGMAAAGALAFKQVGALVLAALLADRAWRLVRERKNFAGAVLDATLLVAGAALVIGGVVGYLRARGILADAVFWTWTYVWQHYIPSGVRGESFGYHFLTGFVPYLAAVWPLVALAPVAFSAELSVLWWWLAATTAAALVGGRMYGHYFLLFLPALATLGGIGAARWREKTAAANWRWVRRYVALASLAFLVAAVLDEPTTGTFWRPDPDYRPAADYVRAHTTPEQRVFVWGWFPPLYQRADRCPSTRFVYTHLLVGFDPTHPNWHYVPEAWPMLLADLTREPPPYILDTSTGDYNFAEFPITRYPQLEAFVEARYTLDRVVGGVRILKLK